MALDQVFKEPCSGCADGEAKAITGTAWNSVTTIHNIATAGDPKKLDSVNLRMWNITDVEIEVSLILNPDDSATQASVDASTVIEKIPPKASKTILDGEAFRKHSSGSNTATIAAYVDSGDSGNVRFLATFSRIYQAVETA